MYEYQNKFSLTSNLAETLSKIISKKEETDYICKLVSVTIPKNKNISSRIDEGYNALNSAHVRKIKKLKGKKSKGPIYGKKYSYLIVVKKDEYLILSTMTFKNNEELYKTLEGISVIFEEYTGDFDAEIFKEKFPYLRNFFTTLDEWREETERVSLSNSILKEGCKKTLRKIKTSK